MSSHMVTESDAVMPKSEYERMVSRPVRNARILLPTASPSFFDAMPKAR